MNCMFSDSMGRCVLHIQGVAMEGGDRKTVVCFTRSSPRDLKDGFCIALNWLSYSVHVV